MNKSETKQAASIVWFEIPADNPDRAKAFYSNLFGWKINPFPGGGDYCHIDTGGADDTPDGALKGRRHPGEPIVNYISVDSVAEFSKRSRSSVAKSACRERLYHRWATLPSARIPRVTPLVSGRAMRMRNNCPKRGDSFVVVLKREKQSTIN